MKTRIFILLIILFVSSIMTAQVPKPMNIVRAVKTDHDIKIDALLDEDVWQNTPASDFIQREPDNGKPASEKTEAWVAYDDDAIYVAAKLYDSHPELIKAELSRRDYTAVSDKFLVFFDCFNDKRSGFYFGISAAGTLYDGVLENDDGTDSSWDGVWTGKARRTDYGWCVELKIPFSQLRFEKQDSYSWGINFERDIARRNEDSYLTFKPRNESGFVSRFPALEGIERISPPKRFQVLPYITGKAEYLKHSPGDPFNSGSKYTPSAGIDLKYGLSSSVTLDASLNPDFGQVEVDPAVVNLSDVETYFQEKRPFFLEGSSIFRYGRGGTTVSSNFAWSEPTLFYSRRIGRAPQGSLPSYDFAERPEGTRILGAAKITGRIFNDWKIGAIQAVTNREFAQIDKGGVNSDIEVEPLTSYSIFRVQKDFDRGMQGLGVLSTFTNRFFKDGGLKTQLNSNSLTVGLDGWTFLSDSREYVLQAWMAGSYINGSRERMLNVQTNSVHYFQRPDIGLSIDSSATSLKGLAGRFFLQKQTRPVWLNAAIGFITPGFELNDLGYLQMSNIISSHFQLGYFWLNPTSYYRSIKFFNTIYAMSDFNGDILSLAYWTNVIYQFLNYYTLDVQFSYSPEVLNNRRTRGGPLTINPPAFNCVVNASTDSREPLVFQILGQRYYNKDENYFTIRPYITYRPAPNFSLSVGPGFSRDLITAQWVGSYADPTASATYGRRYVFANMDQVTFSANIRLDWIITPELSLQAYFQPLISSGDYSNFKELSKTKSFDYNSYGSNGSVLQKSVSSSGAVSYKVDSDGDGLAKSYSFSNPDFNLASLRGNVVLRWEFRTGSTLYFVWTQSRSDYEAIGDFQFGESIQRMYDTHPDNIFMVKFSYWWGK